MMLQAEPVAQAAVQSPATDFSETLIRALGWLDTMQAYLRFGEVFEHNPADRLDEMAASLADIACELAVRGFFVPDFPDWVVDPVGALNAWTDWLARTSPFVSLDDQVAAERVLSSLAARH